MKSIEPHGFVVGLLVVVGAIVAPVVTEDEGFATLEAVVDAVAVVVAAEEAGAAVAGWVLAAGSVVDGSVVDGNVDEVTVVDDDVAVLEHATTIMASATNRGAVLLPGIVMAKG
jgi:hypothetical protein